MKHETAYKKYTPSEIDKLGNTLIYLSNEIPNLTKTKALKLVYLLDEISIKKNGIPFLNLQYEVLQYGPVSQDLFSELNTYPQLLKDYIKLENRLEGQNIVTYLKPKKKYKNDEFTDDDLVVLEFIIKKYGKSSAKKLVDLVHRENSPWYIIAKSKNLLDSFENGTLPTTNYIIDFTSLLDEKKLNTYNSYLEIKNIERSFNI